MLDDFVGMKKEEIIKIYGDVFLQHNIWAEEIVAQREMSAESRIGRNCI